MSDQKSRKEITYDPHLCFFGNILPKKLTQSLPMSAWAAPKNREDDRGDFEGVYGNDRETLKNLKETISSLSRYARQYTGTHDTNDAHYRHASDRLFSLRTQLFNALYAQEKFFAETCLNILIQVYAVHNAQEFWLTLPNNEQELLNIHGEISETLNKIRELALNGVLNSLDKAVPGFVTERFPWEPRDKKRDLDLKLNETYLSPAEDSIAPISGIGFGSR